MVIWMFNVSGTQHHESSSVELSSPSQPCANIYIYSFIWFIVQLNIFSALRQLQWSRQHFTPIFPGHGPEPELTPPNFLGNKICGLIFTIWLVAIYYFASCSHSFYIYSETDRSTAQWWQWWCWFWVRLRPMEYFPSMMLANPKSEYQ